MPAVDPLPNLPPKLVVSPIHYRLRAGYGYTQRVEGPWTEAQICLIPLDAEESTDVIGFVHIDGERCVVFAAPGDRYFAQTEVSCRA